MGRTNEFKGAFEKAIINIQLPAISLNFYPKVWADAAVQIFFSLGPGKSNNARILVSNVHNF